MIVRYTMVAAAVLKLSMAALVLSSGLPWRSRGRLCRGYRWALGRPTFLERYRIALWEAVQSDMPCVPDLQPEMPEGCRPGQPLLGTCELEPALEEVAAIRGSEDEEEPLRQPHKKTHKKLPAKLEFW